MTEPELLHNPEEGDASDFGVEQISQGYKSDETLLPECTGPSRPHQDEIPTSNEFRPSDKASQMQIGSDTRAEAPPEAEAASHDARSNRPESDNEDSGNSYLTERVSERDSSATESSSQSYTALAPEAKHDEAPAVDAERLSPRRHILQTEAVPAVNTQHACLNSEVPPSALFPNEAATSAETSSACRASAPAKQPSRVLQLKAKFEKQRQAVTDSEMHQTTKCSSTVGTIRRDRRQSECARPVSPPPTEMHAAAPCQSVRSLRCRFEHQTHPNDPTETVCESVTSPAAGRRLAWETLQQFGTVDIAARYGKPYIHQEKRTGADDQHDIPGDSEPSVHAESDEADKHAAEEDSPADHAVQTASDFAALGRRNTHGGVFPRDVHSVRTREVPDAATSTVYSSVHSPEEMEKRSKNPASDDEESSADAAIERKDTEGESPSATLCGRPSPEIGRLAAMVAARAQNYGKPVPRRLLTRQDTDAF